MLSAACALQLVQPCSWCCPAAGAAPQLVLPHLVRERNCEDLRQKMGLKVSVCIPWANLQQHASCSQPVMKMLLLQIKPRGGRCLPASSGNPYSSSCGLETRQQQPAQCRMPGTGDLRYPSGNPCIILKQHAGYSGKGSCCAAQRSTSPQQRWSDATGNAARGNLCLSALLTAVIGGCTKPDHRHAPLHDPHFASAPSVIHSSCWWLICCASHPPGHHAELFILRVLGVGASIDPALLLRQQLRVQQPGRVQRDAALRDDHKALVSRLPQGVLEQLPDCIDLQAHARHLAMPCVACQAEESAEPQSAGAGQAVATSESA